MRNNFIAVGTTKLAFNCQHTKKLINKQTLNSTLLEIRELLQV